MFFIAYTFKGHVHAFAGQVKVLCLNIFKAIFKYFCPLMLFSGTRKIPTLGSTVQWEEGGGEALFPTRMVGPQVGIFLSPLNTNAFVKFRHNTRIESWLRCM